MPGGRPSKFNRERADTILQAIREGNTRKVAAGLAGIGERTLYDWESGFPQFSQAIEKAESEAEARHVKQIETASADTWCAAAWWLERRRHADWGRKDKMTAEVSGKDGGPIDVVINWGDTEGDQEDQP